MKGTQRALSVACSLFFMQTSFGASAPLFKLSSTGQSAKVKISLCLNGNRPLTCQNYEITQLSLSILTTIPHRTYLSAGIKINTPGYTVKDTGISCTPIKNGYCLFSVSDSMAKMLVIQTPETIEPALAVGQYDDSTGTTYPMLAVSEDNGTSWAYKIQKGVALPADYSNNASMVSSTCTGTHCMLVGQYSDSTNTNYPVLAISSDAGSTWAYKIQKGVGLPTDYNGFGIINSISCESNNCIIGGSYSDTNNSSYPMLAMSSDAGLTWTYKIQKNMPLPNDYSYGGFFNGTSCNGTICLAGGGYIDSNNTYYPLLAVSSDSGVTWTYKIQKGSTPPSGYINNAQFFSTSCTGDSCVASGSYTSTSNINFPLLSASTDGGATWTYKIQKNMGLPTDFSNNGSLVSASCIANHCSVAGSYADSNNIQYPLLASSSDGGITWVYKIEKGLSLPTDFNNNAGFRTLSCNGNSCVASGGYDDNNSNSYPLLALSTDNGNTWSYKIQKNGGLPTDFSNNGSFNSASCTSTLCIAGGYTVDSNNIQYPLLASSSDSGTTWVYKIKNNLQPLPVDFSTNAIFNSTSYLPKSLGFLSHDFKMPQKSPFLSRPDSKN